MFKLVREELIQIMIEGIGGLIKLLRNFIFWLIYTNSIVSWVVKWHKREQDGINDIYLFVIEYFIFDFICTFMAAVFLHVLLWRSNGN